MSVEVPLTEPEGKEEEYITPPDWIVRMLSIDQGKRGKKYPDSWVRSYGGYSPTQGDYPGWGMDADSSGVSWQRQLAKRRQEEENTPQRGNLPEELYRFWNGASSPQQAISTCRWCRQYAYGPFQRQQHQLRTDHNRILTAVYDFARSRKSRNCFVCNTKTKGSRWGVPLCQKNACLNKWRVGSISDISSVLLLNARMAFHKGLLKQWLNEDRSEKFNMESSPKSFNWESARYC